jgi:hypothetical protein
MAAREGGALFWWWSGMASYGGASKRHQTPVCFHGGRRSLHGQAPSISAWWLVLTLIGKDAAHRCFLRSAVEARQTVLFVHVEVVRTPSAAAPSSLHDGQIATAIFVRKGAHLRHHDGTLFNLQEEAFAAPCRSSSPSCRQVVRL